LAHELGLGAELVVDDELKLDDEFVKLDDEFVLVPVDALVDRLVLAPLDILMELDDVSAEASMCHASSQASVFF